MLSIRTAFVCLALLLVQATRLPAEDLVFLFSSGSTQISALRAGDLTFVRSIDVPSGAFTILATPDGSKYYVLSRSATDSVLVVDPTTLTVTKSISLGATASDGVVTPDGKYLLVAAGTVRVLSTATDTEVNSPIPVGGAPTRILVNNASSRAYVMGASGQALHLIDLASFTTLKAIPGPASDIALTDDDSRLVVLSTNSIKQYRSSDLAALGTLSTGSYAIRSGKIHLSPDGERAFAENGGSPPNVTSLLVGLDDQQVRPLGDIGTTKLEQITVIDERTAYAIETGNGLVKIDFTDPTAPTLTRLQLGITATTLTLSPNGRYLYASALTNSKVTRLEIATNTVTHTIVAPAPPASHITLFDPSSSPAARLIVNGGDDQYTPPGRTLPTELSVKVVDADGRPLIGVPVLFAIQGIVPLQIAPDQAVTTNGRGVAAVRVTVPSRDVLDAAKASLQAGTQQVAQSQEQPLQPVVISATASGVPSAAMTVNIVKGVGLVKISGDFQVAGPGQPFAKPIVVLATDADGDPLPTGTKVDFVTVLGGCPPTVLVDPNGFASAACRTQQIQFTSGTFRTGNIIASLPDYSGELGQALSQAGFVFSIAADPNVRIEKMVTNSGDNQSAPSGTALPLPLRFQLLTNGFFAVTDRGVGVDIRQISGPAVSFDKFFIAAIPGVTQSVKVSLGPAAGAAVIEMRLSAPGSPFIRYNITATGGQPQRLEKLGDGQSGRTGTELANPLQVRVFNESNQLVPFPAVTWTVLEGNASVVTASTATASTARVLLGNTPGTIRIQARAGSLVASFVVEATPPQPVSISTVAGQNQTLTSGELSAPLMVVVNEGNNQPAVGVPVTFSGPPSVLLHSLDDTTTGNPLQLMTDNTGSAGVRAELLASAALHQQTPEQFSSTITITASAGQDLSTTFLLNVVGQTPQLELKGVVNAASFEPGLVPGSLVTLFGQGLSEGVSGTVFVGGDTSFGGTSVKIGGIPAPLMSITGGASEQINLQVPFELTPGRLTTVEVENNASTTRINGISIFSAQPGIFGVDLGGGVSVGAVIHPDTGALVTPDNPADHGEAVSMFITGGGPINPPLPSGVAAPPGPPPVMTLPVIVGVDNKGSEVLFKGYAPGFIGLYQINFVIPANATCGTVPLNIRVGDVTSPRSAIPVRCP